MNRENLKNAAKSQIRGNIGMLFCITVLIELITCAASMLLGWIGPLGTAAANLIAPAFTLSQIIIYMNLTKGIRPQMKDMFEGFKDFWSAFKVQFFTALFTILWALLLIIPGIVKAYSYSMAIYILAENKGMSALEAIRRSKKMMEGHKMELFELNLSFIGWCLLGIVTLGVAFIWVAPYVNVTVANFYYSIKPDELTDDTGSYNPIYEIQ